MSDQPWTVRRVLEWTSGFFSRKGVDSPRLSAELLLAHVLELPRIRLYTDYDRELPAATLERFRELVRRAGEHEPIAYLTGRAQFFSLDLAVTPDVLIPRPDTETLVENAIQFARHTVGMESPRVLDLCTGSGCIAIAVASGLKSATVVATDISQAALAVAACNAQKAGVNGRITFLCGDLFDALPDARPFDLVLANPPYIATEKIAGLDRNVRDFEPRMALDGGADGLTVIRRIVSAAPRYLSPGGRLYVEVAFDQGEAARAMASAEASLADVRILKDNAGHDRVLTAQRRP